MNYSDNTIKSSSYYKHNNDKIYLNNVILENSTLKIQVPNSVIAPTKLHLNLYDSADKYLPTSRISEIPVRSPENYNTDELLLLTKNGKGCVGAKDEAACFASATLQYTNIETVVMNAETNESLK